MMIHSVYFWMTDEARRDSVDVFREALGKLVQIDVIEQACIGRPAATTERPVTDHSFDFSLLLHFRSKDDHDVYQDHPDHHVFVERCRGWWSKVVVYDSEVIAA